MPDNCPGTDTRCTPYNGDTYCAPFCQSGIVDCKRPGYTCAPGGGCLPPGDGG